MSRGFESFLRCQSNCLICLPDKSGNFLVFRAKMAQNTVKSMKTDFGMVNETAPRPAFRIFGSKIPRTFYFKLTEQSRRKKRDRVDLNRIIHVRGITMPKHFGKPAKALQDALLRHITKHSEV